MSPLKLNVKNVLLGRALRSDALGHEKLSRLWGLPIMSSDAVSSVAYAVEEILKALIPFLALGAVAYVGLVALPIIILLLLLVFSYTMIIKHYPNGGAPTSSPGSTSATGSRCSRRPA